LSGNANRESDTVASYNHTTAAPAASVVNAFTQRDRATSATDRIVDADPVVQIRLGAAPIRASPGSWPSFGERVSDFGNQASRPWRLSAFLPFLRSPKVAESLRHRLLDDPATDCPPKDEIAALGAHADASEPNAGVGNDVSETAAPSRWNSDGQLVVVAGRDSLDQWIHAS
jgi:hypothetical protein